jgi:3'-phosphoadenosine 5'-phosphosulfate sulfotransferase (PAPS reductase)/FAD synthetase
MQKEAGTPRSHFLVGEIPIIEHYPSRFPWHSQEQQRSKQLLDQAGDILQEAIDTYDPSHAFILFSGGYDSFVSTSVAVDYLKRQVAIPFFVVHVNTGIGIERTRQFVREMARYYDLPFLEYTTPEDYDKIVSEHGFPGAAAHRFMYTLLKERPLRQVMRDHTPEKRPDEYRWRRKDRDGKRAKWPPRMLFITGVRQEESRRRMGHVEPIQKEDRRIWVAPLTEWTKEDVLEYLRVRHMPKNPVPPILHYSWDCLCGAFAEEGEKAILDVFFPEEAARIDRLTQVTKANGFSWEWDQEPPQSYFQTKKGQLTLEGFEGQAHLCTSCDARVSAKRRAAHDDITHNLGS